MLLPEAVLDHLDAAGWARLVCTSRYHQENSVMLRVQSHKQLVHTCSCALASACSWPHPASSGVIRFKQPPPGVLAVLTLAFDQQFVAMLQLCFH